ncbi:MAG: hypothetical protein JW724_06330 [Candidatus Altiarchaeota archaeon]|nr:hypothetical protein [Candidatus Altiarchaeota archaeon]
MFVGEELFSILNIFVGAKQKTARASTSSFPPDRPVNERLKMEKLSLTSHFKEVFPQEKIWRNADLRHFSLKCCYVWVSKAKAQRPLEFSPYPQI